VRRTSLVSGARAATKRAKIGCGKIAKQNPPAIISAPQSGMRVVVVVTPPGVRAVGAMPVPVMR
jgi:hypothetical protein